MNKLEWELVVRFTNSHKTVTATYSDVADAEIARDYAMFLFPDVSTSIISKTEG